ncbi:MAG: glycine--tRNA ligase subunit beta [Eggerthellaceae bacterium]|jgi:glycyl-tRNA synthetase beta chain
MSQERTLAFEIGTEEIPAFDLHSATQQLEALVPKLFDDLRIPHGEVQIYTTPRRLISIVENLGEKTEALDEEFRGPAAKIAFDEDGNPTKAAIGFARGKGLTVDDLELRDVKGTNYVFATRHIPSQTTIDLLPQVLGQIITGISWPKSCKWGSTHEYFSRPVRWLVALFGDEVVPVHFANVDSGNMTWGHRFLSPGPHLVKSAEDLLQVVSDAHVIVSEELREEAIRAGVAAIEEETGLKAVLPPKTLREVINLCEQPTPLVGIFDEEFLEVPEEIIVDAMLMHQRYFPLYDASGKLTNKFIVVSNGDPDCSEAIIDGNERVVRARLDDAKFFYEEDLKHPLESYIDKLDSVVFQEELGTLKDKTKRNVALADYISREIRLPEEDARDAHRAAYLAKADLVTNAVVEFTSVQGIMGSYYALASGENEQVAQAIAEHYRPRFAGDDLPQSRVGKVIAIADKLDTICGLFSVGQAPTGTSDPFALRRSALGIVTMLESGIEFSLVDAIAVALESYELQGISFDMEAVAQEVIDFFITRETVKLRNEGNEADTIEAILAVGVQEPLELSKRVKVLDSARKTTPELFDNLATAYARAHNLADVSRGTDVNEALLEPVEKSLIEAVDQTEVGLKDALQNNDFASALSALANLRGPIDKFFDEIMVMTDDEEVRDNRLKILNRFVEVFAHVADFGKMAKGAK